MVFLQSLHSVFLAAFLILFLRGFFFFLISTGLYTVFLQSLSTEVSLPSGIRSKSILGDFKTTSTRYPYDQGTF